MSELLAGEGFVRALIWTLAALVLLVVILLAIRAVRGGSGRSLISGGRNRLPRLAVVEAAAVDNQRRLVLVRRDDVEHLLLIGGPSDLVVEQQIRPIPAAGKQAPRTRPTPVQPQPPADRRERPVPQPQAPVPGPAENRAPEPTRQSAPNPAPASARQESRFERTEASRTAVAPKVESTGRKQQPSKPDDEESLLRDINQSIEEIKQAAPADRSESPADNEMSRLLGDISEEKKKKS